MDRGVKRAVGGLTMVAAVIAVVFNLLHPIADDPSDIRETVAFATDKGIWVLDHYMIGLAVAAAVAAFYVIARTIEAEPGRSIARVGLAFGLIGGALLFASTAVDGWAVKEAAEGPVPEAAAAVAYVGEALFLASLGSFFGIAPLLLGASIVNGKVYAGWLGWTGVVAGVLGLATGTVIFYGGFSDFAANILFPVATLLFTVWLGVMGYMLWQSQPATAAAPTTP